MNAKSRSPRRIWRDPDDAPELTQDWIDRANVCHGKKLVRRGQPTDDGNMAQMHNPPHPGEVLQDSVLRKNGGITVTQFAERLGVSRVALSRVVNGKAAMSAELAIRLAAALRASAESWLRMQVAYDLWHARKKRRPTIEPLDSRVISD